MHGYYVNTLWLDSALSFASYQLALSSVPPRLSYETPQPCPSRLPSSWQENSLLTSVLLRKSLRDPSFTLPQQQAASQFQTTRQLLRLQLQWSLYFRRTPQSSPRKVSLHGFERVHATLWNKYYWGPGAPQEYDRRQQDIFKTAILHVTTHLPTMFLARTNSLLRYNTTKVLIQQLLFTRNFGKLLFHATLSSIALQHNIISAPTLSQNSPSRREGNLTTSPTLATHPSREIPHPIQKWLLPPSAPHDSSVGKNSIYFMHYIRILIEIINGINSKSNMADR